MDLSDGEIRMFGTSLDFTIGEIQAVTQIRISPLEKSIFVAPVNGEIQTGVEHLDFSIGEIHICFHTWS